MYKEKAEFLIKNLNYNKIVIDTMFCDLDNNDSTKIIHVKNLSELIFTINDIGDAINAIFKNSKQFVIIITNVTVLCKDLEEISEITRELSILAKKYNITILI